MMQLRNESQIAGLQRFFKTGPGQYAEGDLFLGIKVPITRKVVSEMWRTTDWNELEACVNSRYHEVRLAALLVLVQQFKHSKDESFRQQCVNFYLNHPRSVNNWDLVDLSCYELLGVWALDHDRTFLYDLAVKGPTLWEKRIGLVSTMQLLRHHQLDDTYAIAGLYLQQQPLHDLLQKALGWLLREAGKRDGDRLRNWLNLHYDELPRTSLRYAIERFDADERRSWLARKR